MRPKRDLRLVIFDCDGVLVDSEPIANRVLAEVLRACGIEADAEGCRRRFLGRSIPQIVAAIEAETGRPLPADFEARLWARDRAAFAAELKPVPGVAAALAQIAIAKCVASSGAPEKIRFALALTGLAPYFGANLFSARQVASGKPAPDLFLLAARTMGVRPAACAVIEDSAAGITAARAAGMYALGFVGADPADPDRAPSLRAAGADQVFDDMESLPALLGGEKGASGYSAMSS